MCTVKQLTVDSVPSTFLLNFPTLPQINSDWSTRLVIQLPCGVIVKTPRVSTNDEVMFVYGLFLLHLAFIKLYFIFVVMCFCCCLLFKVLRMSSFSSNCPPSATPISEGKAHQPSICVHWLC